VRYGYLAYHVLEPPPSTHLRGRESRFPLCPHPRPEVEVEVGVVGVLRLAAPVPPRALLLKDTPARPPKVGLKVRRLKFTPRL
jgi:hypothetical protein